MMNYSKLSKKPKLFARFTGLTVKEFNQLFETVEKEYPKFEVERLSRKDRVKAIGQGRKFKLNLKDRLIMFLVYYRLYITYALSEFLFDLNQSNIHRNIKRLEPLIERCIPVPKKLHKKMRRIGTLEELEELVPELKLFLDATEQEIPRPKNKRRRKSHYSGKKKRHTVKTQIMTNKKGLIVNKSRHHKGRDHDYKMFKKRKPRIPPDVEVNTDSGYQGIQKDFPKLKVKIPIKKPKGRKLTKEEKKYNRKLAKERVVIEHSIGKIKKFKIMGEKFRNRLKGYNIKNSIVCGLVNFKILMN